MSKKINLSAEERERRASRVRDMRIRIANDNIKAIKEAILEWPVEKAFSYNAIATELGLVRITVKKHIDDNIELTKLYKETKKTRTIPKRAYKAVTFDEEYIEFEKRYKEKYGKTKRGLCTEFLITRAIMQWSVCDIQLNKSSLARKIGQGYYNIYKHFKRNTELLELYKKRKRELYK